MIKGLRELLWAVAVLLAAILLAYILVVTVPRGSQGEGTVPPIEKSAYDDQLEALDRSAVEGAYHNQVMRLYETWMRDPTGQPNRALTGHRQARKAYIDAMNGIASR